MRGLFLFAYGCSGLAALIYQVTWTRLLTLYMGHTTGAASTVITAFMGGLAGGAFLAGRVAQRLTPRQAVYGYVALECVVALIALIVPFELSLLKPLLAWAYRDGAPGLLFPAVRVISCLLVIFIPALALGATFPLAAHWFAPHRGRVGGAVGWLYAANSAGAALGAVAAGFALIPAIGLSGTTLVGVATGGLSVATVLLVARNAIEPSPGDLKAGADRRVRRAGLGRGARPAVTLPSMRGLGEIAVALSGFAGLMYEVAWMRVFAMLVGPTTYAFAATVAAVIAGIAIGSAGAAWGVARTRHPALWLAVTLAATAIVATYASSLAGGYVPRLVAEELARSSNGTGLLWQRSLIVAVLMLPAALGFGAVFPLALAFASGEDQPTARRVGTMYASNTLAAVGGSLVAGFAAIPFFGLQHTLGIVSGLLVLDALIVIVWGAWSVKGRVVALAPALAAVVLIIAAPVWDHELLASGAYKYASSLPQGLDLESALKAGALVYYREGAASTVSVKRLTGTLSLAIDGKVDASSRGDMLTQKALAHLPLLLHPNPRNVCIIGLGSGVTLGSALVHPVSRADIVEISPEVVEASTYFADVNLHGLDNPRTHLILGDGRSHLLLSSRKYDVIISEPSNPWMAGVAALFTREFFTAARDHLAPGGIMTQWAHTYDISDRDLRSIVATFTSVFPDGTLWAVGEGDLLLVGSVEPLEARLGHIDRSWQRPGVAADLARVSAWAPFAFLSMFAAGPADLRRYTAGVTLQTDDRQALEFSGPRALATHGVDNVSQVQHLLTTDTAPEAIRRALSMAGAAEWRNRAEMLVGSGSFATAYADYVRALRVDPTDRAALDGFVRAAVATGRQKEALDVLQSFASTHAGAPAIPTAMSKLLAATGSVDDAIRMAERACTIEPLDPRALEQLASILSDVGDAGRLDAVVQQLQRLQPERASTSYYAAAAKFLGGQYADAIGLARQAVERDPQFAAAHNLLGAISATVDDRPAARSAFKSALVLDPRDPSIYTNLGLLEIASANRSVASDYFAEALSLDPQSEAARRGLEQIAK